MTHPLLLRACCWLLFLFFLSSPAIHADSYCQAEWSTVTNRLTGYTRAKTVLDITSEVSGRCKDVYADIGEPIPIDTVFARLDPTFIELDLEANEIARKQTEKTFAFDKTQVERYRKLVTTKASAKTKLDELELQYDQTELKLQQLETEHSRLQETLRRHTIQAPSGWLVMQRQVEPGEWVAAGQPIARVGDFQHLIVPLAVRPAELHYLQQQKTFPLFLVDPAFEGMGTIERISPAFDPVTRKTTLDISLTADTLAKLPTKRGGLRVEIPITTPDPMRAFVLPAEAVEERYEEHWLTRENGEALRVVVLGPELTPQSKDKSRIRVVSPEIREGDRFKCRSSGQITQ